MRWSCLLLWVVLVGLAGLGVVVQGDIRAVTQCGNFVGSQMLSRGGRDLHAFRGIRYADPPTGQLRFQAPRPILSYPEPVDATDEGPVCPQPTFNLFTNSEDCLRLNVYRPAAASNLPVLVFFHPGGFYVGAGVSTLYGPHYLLDKDILLVTVNYRLGALGFLSTGDKHAPGNAGFKDQVAALQWVQRNIAGFGGDPSAVTIAGYSAGSFSVILHMLSPMSKGLFHRGIAMSGSPTAQWEVPPHQRHLAEKQAQLLNCPTSPTTDMLACLRRQPAQLFGDSLPQFFEFGTDPVLLWRPVVEPDCGQSRFLSDDPELLIRRGDINHVPLILGVCQLEFTGIGFSVLSNETLRPLMESEWDRLAPISFLVDPPTARVTTLRSHYLGDDPHLYYDNRTSFALGRLYADGLISYGVHKAAKLLSQHIRELYYYRFNYTGDMSHAYYPGTTTPIGAVHHDELIYLFRGDLFPSIPTTGPHSAIVDRMVHMWTNFVTHGKPRPSDTAWPPMTATSRRYLQINNNNLQVLTNMDEDRFQLWEQLFPLKPLRVYKQLVLGECPKYLPS